VDKDVDDLADDDFDDAVGSGQLGGDLLDVLGEGGPLAFALLKGVSERVKGGAERLEALVDLADVLVLKPPPTARTLPR